MNLTKEQQAILDGEKGDVLARVMKTLVRYGELFGADSMVPVTSEYNHLVTSFGLKALTPVYELMDKLIESGNVSTQKFSADPRPLDKNVPSSFLQDFIFKNFMYSKQVPYEKQLNELGLMEKDAFTCTCYMDEVGNKPQMGSPLSLCHHLQPKTKEDVGDDGLGLERVGRQFIERSKSKGLLSKCLLTHIETSFPDGLAV